MYEEEYEETEEVYGSETVEAGLVSSLIKNGSKFLNNMLNFISNSLDSLIDESILDEIRNNPNKTVKLNNNWNYMEVLTGGDYSEEQQKPGNYPYILGIRLVGISDDYCIADFALGRKGEDKSKAVSDTAVRLNFPEGKSVSELSNDDFMKFLKETVNDSFSKEVTNLLEKLGVAETVEDMQPIKLSTSIQVTLQKIVSNDEIDLRLVSINSSYDVDTTNSVLNDLIDSPDFVDELPTNEPASYNIFPEEDSIDVEECETCEVDMSQNIFNILKPLYKLYYDCMYFSWNATGVNYPAVVNLADVYHWMSKEAINKLSEYHYSLFNYAPHPATFAADASGVECPDAITCLQGDITNLINAIDLFYCNFEGTIQTYLLDTKSTFEHELNYTLARF